MIDLSRVHYEDLVRRELEVDLGLAGDVTTRAVAPEDGEARATIAAREPGRVCGVEVALAVFECLGGVGSVVAVGDGEDVEAGTAIVRLAGSARSILAGERTALNLLGHLSGVATATRELVRAVAVTRARVVDTRKTTPGLRALEKYAVRIGGGANHRFGLHDAVLIKDNHVALAGGVEEAVRRARSRLGHMVRLELEVDDLEQLAAALDLGVDAVLLDNFSLGALERAVEMARGRAVLEASGGITRETIAAVAATGVDLISVGAITHSAPALDVGLDFVAS